MTMPRASFLSVLAFVAAVAGGTYLLEVFSTRLGVAIAHAEALPLDAGIETPTAPAKGSASSVTVTQSTTVTSADQLHDVLTDPAGAAEDVKALATVKWGYAALAILILLTRAIARIPGKAGAWLRTGYRAAIITGAGAVATAVFNVAITGAAWLSLLIVAFGAIVGLMDPVPAGPQTPSTKAETKAS